MVRFGFNRIPLQVFLNLKYWDESNLEAPLYEVILWAPNILYTCILKSVELLLEQLGRFKYFKNCYSYILFWMQYELVEQLKDGS